MKFIFPFPNIILNYMLILCSFFPLPHLIIISLYLGPKHQTSYLNLTVEFSLDLFASGAGAGIYYYVLRKGGGCYSNLLIFGNLNVHGEFIGDRQGLQRQVGMKYPTTIPESPTMCLEHFKRTLDPEVSKGYS